MRISPGQYKLSRTTPVEIDKIYYFDYPVEFVTLPDYSAHRGQRVTVIRQLTDDECDPDSEPMWRIRATDGWTGDASDYELEDKPLPPVEQKV